MERRKNTVKANWLMRIARHLIKNQPKTAYLEKRNENIKSVTSVRSVGNYSFAQSDSSERQ